jgi:hypothetical protein
MESAGGGRAVRSLLASIALLLVAGAVSAAVIDTPASTPTASGRATAPDGTTTTVTAAPATTSSSSTTVATTVLATTTTRRPTTATTARAVTASTVPSTRPPIQTIPIPPTLPNLRPASSWQADKNGVSARVHIEPASPVAGQPVRFVIDVSSAQACCIILVIFGDGSLGASNLAEVCSGAEPLSPGPETFETTHTYPAPGAYRATVSIEDGNSCPQSAPPGGRVGTPDVTIEACFAVGPGTAGQGGCRPGFGTP